MIVTELRVLIAVPDAGATELEVFTQGLQEEFGAYVPTEEELPVVVVTKRGRTWKATDPCMPPEHIVTPYSIEEPGEDVWLDMQNWRGKVYELLSK